LAEHHLGEACSVLLTPLWRRLSKALNHLPFDPAHPRYHLSYTAAKAQDWAEVRQAIECETQWRHHAALLERHAIACHHLSDPANAIASWFLLCWQFPQLSMKIANNGDYSMEHAWETFLDLDPELPPEDFPAWLLLHTPGTTRIVPMFDSNTPCPDSYRTVFAIKQHHQTSGRAATEKEPIALRAQLKRQSPILFQYFLDTLS
jgi:hypothetical protein